MTARADVITHINNQIYTGFCQVERPAHFNDCHSDGNDHRVLDQQRQRLLYSQQLITWLRPEYLLIMSFL